MTPADEIRAAAEKLRARAAAVPPPPWSLGGIGDYGWTVRMGNPAGGRYEVIDTRMDSDEGRALAQFIATMHPGVSLALATWLASFDGIDISEHAAMSDDVAHALAVASLINQHQETT